MGSNYLDTFQHDLLKREMFDVSILESLSQKILEKEKFIINLNDGTQVPFKNANPNNITKFHRYYNLMDFGFVEMDLFVLHIKKMMYELFGWEHFYLKTWANIFRRNDFLGLHKHMGNNDSKIFPYAISGQCILYSSQPSYTTFLFKKEKKSVYDSSLKEIDINNKPGEIVLFSSYVEHEFKQWDGDLRIGIAFDINNEPDAYIKWLKDGQFRYV